jgi:hypothetical protein
VSYTLDVCSKVKITLNLASSFLKQMSASCKFVLAATTEESATGTTPLHEASLEILAVQNDFLNSPHIIVLNVKPSSSIYHSADPFVKVVALLP